MNAKGQSFIGMLLMISFRLANDIFLSSQSTSYLRNFYAPYSILALKWISCTFCEIVCTKINVSLHLYCFLQKVSTNSVDCIEKTDNHISKASCMIYLEMWHNNASSYNNLSLFPLESHAVFINRYSQQHLKQSTSQVQKLKHGMCN